MREKIINITIVAVLVMGITVRSGFAQGLLGKRYIGLNISQTTPGNVDVKDFDDSILGLGGGINVPLDTNLDAVFNLNYAKLEGDFMGFDLESSAIGLFGGLNYHFMPDKKVDPFVGISAGLVKTEAKFSYLGYEISDDKNDFAIIIGAGVEIDLNEKISFRPNIGYGRIGDIDDFAAGIGLNMWFSKSVFGGLYVSYAFDEGDVCYSAGIGFGF